MPEPSRSHTGKYRLLWQWLCQQEGDVLKLTFAQIEAILGFRLPDSSRNHLSHWYGYKGSAVARSILDAGWKATSVGLAAETVTLVRSEASSG